MITTIFGGISATPWTRAALRYGAIALAIVLFLLSIRRSGERIGRIAERLQASEKTYDIQRQMLDAASRRPPDRGALIERQKSRKTQHTRYWVSRPFRPRLKRVSQETAGALRDRSPKRFVMKP